METSGIEKKLAQYRAQKEKLPDLKAAVTEIENLCRNAIRNQWGLCRATKHGTVREQIDEICGNIHAPDEMKSELASLRNPLLKAIADVENANRLRIRLLNELCGETDSALGAVRSRLSGCQRRIFEKIVAGLIPYTSQHSATALAKECDALKALDHLGSTLGAVAAGDPETSVSMLESALISLEQYEVLAE